MLEELPSESTKFLLRFNIVAKAKQIRKILRVLYKQISNYADTFCYSV